MSLFHNHYNRPDLYKLFTTFYVNTNANENVSLHTRNNLYLLYVDYCFLTKFGKKHLHIIRLLLLLIFLLDAKKFIFKNSSDSVKHYHGNFCS